MAEQMNTDTEENTAETAPRGNAEEQLAAFLGQYKKDVAALADSLRSKEMPPLTEELFSLYEKTGNRLKYENVYFYRREFLCVFGVAAILWHRTEDMRKLEEVILSICREKCWALPAHVSRENNPDWAVTVDLFASETGEAFAEIYHALYHYMDLSLLQLMREETERRVIRPVMAKQPYASWESQKMNWNAVCCGSVGTAAQYMLPDGPEKTAFVSRMTEAIRCYIAGFGEDGACREGLDYWTYGMSFYTMFADVLDGENAANDLMEGEKIENIAAFQQNCFFEGGRTVSFSDGFRFGRWRLGLACFLADRYNRSGRATILFPDFSCCLRAGFDHNWRFSQMYRDIIWTERLLEDVRAGKCTVGLLRGSSGTTVFPDAQWVICRHQGGFSWAAKGGDNDEPHNHNDVGSFFLLHGSTEVLCDLGSGEYTKQYFSDGRYSIFCNNAESHNIPIAGGLLQKEGAEHRCDKFLPDPAGKVQFSLAGAYELPSGCVLTRDIDGSDPDAFRVTDRFTVPEGPAQLEENFVTQLRAEEKDGGVCLSDGEGHVFRMVLPEGCGPVKILSRIHMDHSGNRQTVTEIRFAVPQKEGTAVCTTEIRPE